MNALLFVALATLASSVAFISRAPHYDGDEGAEDLRWRLDMLAAKRSVERIPLEKRSA